VKKLLGALFIALLALAWSAPEAEARRCWWNGYDWVCKQKPRPHAKHWRKHHRNWHAHRHHRPYAHYPAPPYYYYGPYYRPYW
jgi:hypothetical protein